MLMPMEDARILVLEACTSLDPCPVPTREALGLATAEPSVARHDAPRFANSAMDGYAVRAADTDSAPVVLPVAGVLVAGSDPTGTEVRPQDRKSVV